MPRYVARPLHPAHTATPPSPEGLLRRNPRPGRGEHEAMKSSSAERGPVSPPTAESDKPPVAVVPLFDFGGGGTTRAAARSTNRLARRATRRFPGRVNVVGRVQLPASGREVVLVRRPRVTPVPQDVSLWVRPAGTAAEAPVGSV